MRAVRMWVRTIARGQESRHDAQMTFTGFPKTAPAFFHELAVEMNRDWFLANKARYETEWVTPMTDLLADVARRVAPAYQPTKLEPKIMRIHRDVRFAKDKTPYKTHIGAAITVGGKKMGEGASAALYLHLGTEEEYVGAGTYFFDAAQLAKWRKTVAGKEGAVLSKLVTKLRKAGYTVGGHDDYKKVPKPYAADHPHAELLKWKGLTAGAGELPRGILHKAALADWLVGHAKALAPLVTWLHAKIR